MIKITHSLNFVTEIDETHSVGIRIMQLPEAMRVEMLESMLRDLLAPVLNPELKRLNENSSYAVLKLVK